MTIRIVNDDPRCLRQQACQMPRPFGNKAACMRCIRAARVTQVKAAAERIRKWNPPAGLDQMYRDLGKKLGLKEARRLVDQHAAIIARRERQTA